MPKDMAETTPHLTKGQTAPETTKDAKADRRPASDDKPAEGGLSREELRALVVEMIG